MKETQRRLHATGPVGRAAHSGRGSLLDQLGSYGSMDVLGTGVTQIERYRERTMALVQAAIDLRKRGTDVVFKNFNP